MSELEVGVYRRRRMRPVVGWIGVMLLAVAAEAQVVFDDAGPSRGIGPYVMALGPIGGIAAADYDNDGDVDLFIPNAGGVTDQLYRNDGAGQFTEIAATVGLDLTGNHRVALWFDYDGDHDLDLIVGGDCRVEPPEVVPCPNRETLWLYRQTGDGTFEDVTLEAGIDAAWGGKMSSHRSGLAAGDLNNDGYLDLIVSNWWDRVYLLINDGRGAFVERTAAAGLPGINRGYQMPVMVDLDGDGWLDIYHAVDIGPNHLWINRRDGTFVDRARDAGINNLWNDMGIALGDYDNDGDFDIYVTEIASGAAHNVFYRNDSTGSELRFAEIANTLGVEQGYWGWGATFLDCDKDGWLDLATTNGRNRDAWQVDPSRFFHNQGGMPVSFADVSDTVSFNDTYIGTSLVAVDYDRDGDLDLVQSCSEGGPLRLLDNVPSASVAVNHYLNVKPRMAGTNHFAIGATVRVTVGSTSMMRLITAGTSMAGQEPAEAFFGTGAATVVDSVSVEWPDGRLTTVQGVAVDQVLTIGDGGAAPRCIGGADGHGNDAAALASCFTGPNGTLAQGCGCSDLDGDSDVDCDDWERFVDAWRSAASPYRRARSLAPDTLRDPRDAGRQGSLLGCLPHKSERRPRDEASERRAPQPGGTP